MPTIRMLGPDDATMLVNLAPGGFDNTVDPHWTAELESLQKLRTIVC
jgi:hypothetical protein